MSKVFIISDHHFSHASILDFEGDHRAGETVAEHNEWLIDQHNSIVKKRDTVWCLGDFYLGTSPGVMSAIVNRMNGTLNLVMGNHDEHPSYYYTEAFNQVRGVHSYKSKYVFSHVPLHEFSTDRWNYNFHGHIHHMESPEGKYINTCIEKCEGLPMTVNEWLDFYGKPQIKVKNNG